MMASVSGRPWRAARRTESGLPPTPIQVLSRPDSIGGWISVARIGVRVVPFQVTSPPFRISTNRPSRSSNSSS